MLLTHSGLHGGRCLVGNHLEADTTRPASAPVRKWAPMGTLPRAAFVFLTPGQGSCRKTAGTRLTTLSPGVARTCRLYPTSQG